MHSAQRKTREKFSCQCCLAGNSPPGGSWDDYAFYIGCSPALCFLLVFLVVNWEGQQTSTISIDFEMQRQPRAISNTWMLHTVGFSLPTWQEQTRICQQNRQNKTITQNRQNCVGLWDLYAVRFQRCDVESCSTLVLALVGSVLKFLELEFSVVDQTQTFPNLRIFVASGHRTAVHVSVKRGTYWPLG